MYRILAIGGDRATNGNDCLLLPPRFHDEPIATPTRRRTKEFS
jgi:hypothetical protein